MRATGSTINSPQAETHLAFAHAQLGQEIPAALYNAVAEVLAWVHQLRRFEIAGGERPHEPSGLPLPPELDAVPAGFLARVAIDDLEIAARTHAAALCCT